jgi:hypothetical protein
VLRAAPTPPNHNEIVDEFWIVIPAQAAADVAVGVRINPPLPCFVSTRCMLGKQTQRVPVFIIGN